MVVSEPAVFGGSATVVVNTNSTAPSIAPVATNQCPNSDIVLSASGGIVGTGANIEWYTGPNGTGANVGTGASITVNPTANVIYHARREGNL